MQIVAVGMLSPALTGRDVFFVQLGEDEVMQYEAFKDGTVRPIWPSPEPMAMVAASIEKFNHGYRVVQPVPISGPDVLPQYLAKFEIIDDTKCRYLGP